MNGIPPFDVDDAPDALNILFDAFEISIFMNEIMELNRRMEESVRLSLSNNKSMCLFTWINK